MMASVLPFIGGVKTVRADEEKNLNEKAKSELDQAKEDLKKAQDKKGSLENELTEAREKSQEKEKEKQENLENRANVEDKIKKNEEILGKEAKVKEVEEKSKDLDQRMQKANDEANATEKTLIEAKENLKNEQDNPSQNFASSDKVEELKKEYDRAQDFYEAGVKEEKKLKAELAEKEKEFYQVYGKKKSIEDFFDDYERDPANTDKVNTEEYKAFKEKSLAQASKENENYQRLESAIEEKNKQIEELNKDIEKREEDRNIKHNAFKKEELGLNYETEYNNKIIKDNKLDDIERQKAEDVKRDYKILEQCKKEKEEAKKTYDLVLENEARKQKEIEKSRQTAEWLKKKIADGEDAFVEANKKELRNLVDIHEQRKKAIIKELEKQAKDPNYDKKSLEYKKGNQLAQAQSAYETSIQSQKALKDFREYLENKKNGKPNAHILKALEEKVKEAEAEIKKKVKNIRELEKEDENLRAEQKKLGNLTSIDIEKAKTDLENDRKNLEDINSHINELENSPELKEVKRIQDEIKILEKKIEEINNKIKNLEKPGEKNKNNRPSYDFDWKILDKNEEEKPSIDKKEERSRRIGAYFRLKLAIKDAKNAVAFVEGLINNNKISQEKRLELAKIIGRQKVHIILAEKHLEDLAASL